VLRAIDKLDRLDVEGVRALLGEGRKDESGDFTEGAGLSPDRINQILKFIHTTKVVGDQLTDVADQDQVDPLPTEDVNNVEAVRNLRDQVKVSSVGQQGVDELEEIAKLLLRQGYGPDRVRIDTSVVRGLGYYTGPVFEAELTFEITDEKGRTRNFGSVAGGGRYDDLVTRFTGQQVPATGISIGVDRLLAALRARNPDAAPAPGPVVVTVMDRDRMADYQSIAATLRHEGIRAEVYLGNPRNFGNQLKYADRRHAPAAIIQGSDEAARGVVQVKDLILGAKIAEGASVEEWKGNPSQSEVPLEGVVAEVERILALHGLAP
jgi:histidyl-tRNA synthetase